MKERSVSGSKNRKVKKDEKIEKRGKERMKRNYIKNRGIRKVGKIGINIRRIL
jgi:hypothetical protein